MNARMYRFAWLLSLLLIGTAHGQHAGASAPDPFAGLDDSIAISQGALPYNTTAGLAQRNQAFDPTKKNLVIIFAGQSNCTTVNPSLYTPPSTAVIDQVNIYDGGSYQINGSILGTQTQAPTNLGNVAARVAQNAITGGFDRVIVEVICIGGTTAADWATGTLANRIPIAIKRLIYRGYVPNSTGLEWAIYWMQGENDNTNGTSALSYTTSMNTILANAQAAGFNCAACWFFVNEETWDGIAFSATIQGAQTALWGTSKFKAGFNLDSIGAGGRQGANGPHLNDSGAVTGGTGMWSAMVSAGYP